MKSFLQHRIEKAGFWFRNCCVCRLGAPPVAWLCKSCWKKLQGYYLPPEDMIREQGGWLHARLFDWGEENDFFIRLFLRSLKKGGPVFIFQMLAQDFLQGWWRVRRLPTKAVLVPAPHRPFCSRDHALSLARSFSQYTGLEVYRSLLRIPTDLAPLKPLLNQGPLIKGSEGQAQKQKNKQDRGKLKLLATANLPSKNHTVIFVDDILTTGATARSAYQALNPQQKFMIFTLTYRQPQSGG